MIYRYPAYNKKKRKMNDENATILCDDDGEGE
jgi:cbb3-type cytochrome oxidase subunit 3